MAFELSEFLTQTMNMVPESDTELDAQTRNQLIKQAVSDYSQDKPDIVGFDFTGDGGKYYPLFTTLTSYVDGFSRIQTISYIAATIASDELPNYLEPQDWDEDFYATAGRFLFFPNHSPASTETVRVTHTALYTWSAGTTTTAVNQTTHGFSVNDFVYASVSGATTTWVSAGTGSTADLLATHQVTAVADTDNFTATILAVTIPESDFFAVCNRAACLICRSIAERFARTSDSTITADSVDHTSRSQLFADRAKDFCKLYNDHIGINMDAQGNKIEAGHAEFVDLTTGPNWQPTRRYMFHNTGRR
jgi:hypothetical protein